MERAIAQRRQAIRIGWGIALWAVVGLAVAVTPLLFQRYLQIDPETIAGLGYPAIFVVNALGSVTLFLPVPGLAVVMFGGSVLNPWLVALVAAAGMAGGMVGPYILGSAGNAMLAKATAGKSNVLLSFAARVGGWYRKYGILAAFLLAAVPNPVFDFAGLIAGAARMPLWKFLLGTFLGKVAQCLVVSLGGFYLASLVANIL